MIILLGPPKRSQNYAIQIIQISSSWFSITALANPDLLVCSKWSTEERESKRKVNLAEEESYEWSSGCSDYENKYSLNSVLKVHLLDPVAKTD